MIILLLGRREFCVGFKGAELSTGLFGAGLLENIVAA
jgi:hypothetical protein